MASLVEQPRSWMQSQAPKPIPQLGLSQSTFGSMSLQVHTKHGGHSRWTNLHGLNFQADTFPPDSGITAPFLDSSRSAP